MHNVLHWFLLLLSFSLDLLFPKSKIELEIEKIDLKNLVSLRSEILKEKTVYYLFSYRNILVKNLIKLIKYKKNKKLIKSCGLLLAKEIKNSKKILIPIPQSNKRKRERGFNQTEILCKIISQKNRDLIYKPKIIKRIKDRKSQTKLSKSRRKENVKKTMKISKKDEVFLKNKEIILIDDVWTTGSTLEEAFRVLEKAKVKKIIAYTLAH
jgi:competence protein ComFC